MDGGSSRGATGGLSTQVTRWWNPCDTEGRWRAATWGHWGRTARQCFRCVTVCVVFYLMGRNIFVVFRDYLEWHMRRRGHTTLSGTITTRWRLADNPEMELSLSEVQAYAQGGHPNGRFGFPNWESFAADTPSLSHPSSALTRGSLPIS